MTLVARHSGTVSRWFSILLLALSSAAAPTPAESVQAQKSSAKTVAVIHCDYPPVTYWDKATNSPAGFYPFATTRATSTGSAAFQRISPTASRPRRRSGGAKR